MSEAVEIMDSVSEQNSANETKTKKKMNKNGVWKGFFLGVLFSAVIFLIYRNVSLTGTNKEDVLKKCVEEYYLNDADEAAMQEGTYKGLIEGLGDPYSAYFTAEENSARVQEYGGSYKGIGVVIQKDAETGMITIVNCYEGSPAEQAGIMSGDIVYLINGETAAEKTLEEAVEIIKGSGDAGVDLTLIREGMNEYLGVNVVPNDIEYPVVSHSMLENQIGYLALTDFKESSYHQFHEALEDLKSQNMRGLIVDLRNNTGGLLDSVTSILNDILPKGTIVYTVDKYGTREDYTSDGKTPLEIPMVILVNGYTASASEIFAGAVRDYDMAKLVGTQTYGKGVVQTTIRLADGSALKLTTANYYTPNGTNINGTGLTPDVEVEPDLTPLEDGSYYDNQLAKAQEVIEEMF